MIARITAVLLLALAGCSSVPLPEQVPEALMPADAPPPLAAGQALATSPAMRQWLETEVMPLARRVGPRRALLTLLFDGHGRVRVAYDAASTRTAAEAFDARAGNCLSLVLLTASLARALELPVTFQAVDTADGWDRRGEFLAYSGHVNIVLGSAPLRRLGTELLHDTRVVVDFLPPSELRGHTMRPLHESEVLGMFLNNRAAEALAAGRPDEAAAWVGAALRQTPQLVAAWNTLALLHHRRGDAELAARVLQQALAAEPRNTRVLANLIGLLERSGRAAEAAPLRVRLERLEPEPPGPPAAPKFSSAGSPPAN